MDTIAKQLTRSRHNRVFGGVCGGLADYLATDVVLVRIAYLALTLISGGMGVLLYVVGWIIIPLEPMTLTPPVARPSAAPGGARVILGVAFVAAGLLAVSTGFLPWFWHVSPTRIAAPFLLILCGLVLLLWRTHRDEHETPSASAQMPEQMEVAGSEQPAPKTEPRRLMRLYAGRKLAGVCSGLGAYLNVDPVVVRLIWVALVLAGGIGLLLYVIAWIVIPMEK